MPELTLETEPLRARTQAALADPTLRLNLRAATDRLDALRGPALDQLADADALRSQARALRGRTIAQLPDLLETFVERLLDLGVHVHWADDAADAVACVTAVAQRRGVRTVVKSKSMAAEEIGLNAALESAGVDVVETDLGEWIIQVAQETPSHIIVPAIHKNRAQIAQTLRRVADGNLSDVPSELAAFARRTLRPAFLRAEMGISGVNFGVASAGSLVLVTNEGNGRLVTAAPAIHVAVMGMERLVADFAELDVMLALLARSATGQSLTAYTSLISGPRRPGEADGPDEVHVVILDNGRSAILGSELREILHCIRCGACLNVCPVYRQVGGHAYGWGSTEVRWARCSRRCWRALRRPGNSPAHHRSAALAGKPARWAFRCRTCCCRCGDGTGRANARVFSGAPGRGCGRRRECIAGVCARADGRSGWPPERARSACRPYGAGRVADRCPPRRPKVSAPGGDSSHEPAAGFRQSRALPGPPARRPGPRR